MATHGDATRPRSTLDTSRLSRTCKKIIGSSAAAGLKPHTVECGLGDRRSAVFRSKGNPDILTLALRDFGVRSESVATVILSTLKEMGWRKWPRRHLEDADSA